MTTSMDLSAKFFVGVVVALLSGIVNNLGNLFQKKAINDYLKSKLQYIQLNSGGEQQIDRYALNLSLINQYCVVLNVYICVICLCCGLLYDYICTTSPYNIYRDFSSFPPHVSCILFSFPQY